MAKNEANLNVYLHFVPSAQKGKAIMDALAEIIEHVPEWEQPEVDAIVQRMADLMQECTALATDEMPRVAQEMELRQGYVTHVCNGHEYLGECLKALAMNGEWNQFMHANPRVGVMWMRLVGVYQAQGQGLVRFAQILAKALGAAPTPEGMEAFDAGTENGPDTPGRE